MLKLICRVICFLLVISGFAAPSSAQNTQHTIEEPVAGLTQADSQQINTEHTTEYTQARTHIYITGPALKHRRKFCACWYREKH
ncbi:MAG: hypothetical protein KBA53_07865 [Thermoclostridium sp.]|nr:hypothetical protein [Thermoclostridium sp.]